MNRKLGLYIHIPFCRSKCNYCDFYSLPGAESLYGRYEEALRAHIREAGQFLEDFDVDTVYFGGGTPSCFGEKRLTAVLTEIGKRFYLDSDCEITLEANPESVDAKSMQRLRRAGFNRVSLGVQSSDNQMLRVLGRPHTWERAKRAAAACREAGIKNLSVDIIYGLPGQTMKNWQQTLEDVMQLGTEHISCYGLKIEEGTPFGQRKNELDLPDDDAQADMYLYAARELTESGYSHYEISNFAKKGYISRHNMKYWTLGEYLGFGPSAHSDLNGQRFACIRDLRKYIDNINNGESVITDAETIPPRVRVSEYIMLGLRTQKGISSTELEKKYGEDFEKFRPYVKRLVSGGFAREFEDRVHLTARGFLISNTIISDMLAYM